MIGRVHDWLRLTRHDDWTSNKASDGDGRDLRDRRSSRSNNRSKSSSKNGDSTVECAAGMPNTARACRRYPPAQEHEVTQTESPGATSMTDCRHVIPSSRSDLRWETARSSRRSASNLRASPIVLHIPQQQHADAIRKRPEISNGTATDCHLKPDVTVVPSFHPGP